MSGFGYTVLGFGSHPSRGPAALSISLSVTNTNVNVDTSGIPPDQAGTADSNAGEADSTASASGGDGSYSFAWTITELTDDGQNGHSCAILSEGTKTNARYNTATFRVSFAKVFDPLSGPVHPPPQFNEARYRLRCTVTDGNSDTATADYTVVVTAA